jgi:hypothetical protein
VIPAPAVAILLKDAPSLFRSTSKPDSLVELSVHVNSIDVPSTVAISSDGAGTIVLNRDGSKVCIGVSGVINAGLLMAAELTESPIKVMNARNNEKITATFFIMDLLIICIAGSCA